MTIFWIVAAIVVVGLIIWYLMARKKKGPTLPREPEGPAVPPPPPSPPETPGM
jgi:hypothetical protein